MKQKPKNDIAEAIEVFESSHYTQPTHEADSGYTKYSKQTPPRFVCIRKLKQRRSDYMPGPVHVYTEQEIEEYEDDRRKLHH